MTEEDIKRFAAAAAEDSVRKILAELGLHDRGVASDIQEMRGLLDAWRDAKKSVRQTVVRWATTAFLTFVAGAVGYSFWGRH